MSLGKYDTAKLMQYKHLKIVKKHHILVYNYYCYETIHPAYALQHLPF